MNQVSVKKKPHFKRIVLVFSILVVMAIGMLAVVPAIFPSIGAQVADILRAVLGPDVVANIETASFRIQDVVNQKLYWIKGSQSGFTFDTQNNTQNLVIATPSALPISVGADNQNNMQSPNAVDALPPTVPGVVLASNTNVITSLPEIGWQAYGTEINGNPVMARALLTLDPKRPYAAIALVRIDLFKLQLHMMPGALEPAHNWNIMRSIPNMGLTPTVDQEHIVAGFNGGFKAVNGNYGMMVDNISLLPPVPGIATLAIYKNGQIRIGVWGTDILPNPDMIAYRQNCPPIIQAGKIAPLVADDNRIDWGRTISNNEITWRTAVGLSQDRRYLIYAVGNATVVSTLAQALQMAGAYNAMQLDINKHYAHFVTYTLDLKGRRTAMQLLGQMESDPKLYLVTHSRDYFYLTTK